MPLITVERALKFNDEALARNMLQHWLVRDPDTLDRSGMIRAERSKSVAGKHFRWRDRPAIVSLRGWPRCRDCIQGR